MKILAILLLCSFAPLVTHHDYAIQCTLVSKHDGMAVIATEFGTYAFPVSPLRFADHKNGDACIVEVRRGWIFGHRVLSAD